MDFGGRALRVQLAARYGLQQSLVHLHVGAELPPPIHCAGSSEEGSPTELVIPGQGREPPLMVLLGSTDVVQVTSAGGHNQVAGIAGAELWVYSNKKSRDSIVMSIIK